MLVYSNRVPVRSPRGIAEPLETVSDWLGRKLRRRVDPAAVLRGCELRGKDGWSARSVVAVDQYPHLAAIELIHPDSTVSGRRWHSEIGFQQRADATDIDLTVLVSTSEVSSRVTAPVSPGAPTFVADILRRCSLSSDAVGGACRQLGDDDAEAFRHVILDGGRSHPFVVVSPTRSGDYLVDTALLCELLIGIAEPVVIPPDADTFWLARSVGADFVPYLGAVKLIDPVGSYGRASVRTITAQDFAAKGFKPHDATREVFSLVLHRTNVPLSWRHVSPTRVREEILRRELERRKRAAVTTGNAAEYAAFLEQYVKEQEDITQAALQAKRVAEEALENAQRLADEAERELRSKNAALKFQLENARTTREESPYAPDDAIAIADTIAEAVERDPPPEACLKVIEHLFAERVVILPEAWTSSRESAGFRYGRKLYALLHALCTTYWSALKTGRPDQEARQVFGNAYAAKESEGVASNKGAKRKRTFRFAGQDHLMVKHLKIGVKDSAAESIRVHFEWFADRGRIVIGHCGPHIPFS